MLASLSVSSFANHSSRTFSLSSRNVFFGKNGSGKTNLLEAIAFLLNGQSFSAKSPDLFLPSDTDTFSIGGAIAGMMDIDIRASYSQEDARLRFAYQNKASTRPKYLESVAHRAVAFSPLDVAMLYGSPDMRRTFLDQTLSLAYPSFDGVRKQYQLALKSRNKILKMVKEGTAPREEVARWDTLFADAAVSYYDYRYRIADFLSQGMTEVARLLHKPYVLSFEYVSKARRENLRPSIIDYLQNNTERDILIGHTYIGPHLDDFSLYVSSAGTSVPCHEYLSFGENKALFLGLKMLTVAFLEGCLPNTKIVLLFDDVFAELDDHHRSALLERFSSYQFFITSQTRLSDDLFSGEITYFELY